MFKLCQKLKNDKNGDTRFCSDSSDMMNYNIGTCSLIANCGRVRKPIGGIYQFVMWYSGLRGTIGFILALQCSIEFKEGNGNVIVLMTITFALFTVYLKIM